jgi:hypothetical protein
LQITYQLFESLAVGGAGQRGRPLFRKSSYEILG